jgi:hypothetical protein
MEEADFAATFAQSALQLARSAPLAASCAESISRSPRVDGRSAPFTARFARPRR